MRAEQEARMTTFGWAAVLALSCAAAGAALLPDESPPAAGEWGFRPADGKPSAVDPPGFVWRPQRDARTYDLQVSRDADFAQLAHEARGLSLDCCCPGAPLGVGAYHWRFRFTTGAGEVSEWSTARRFTIDASSRPFPLPDREELLSRIPAEHPRLFLRPEDVATYRELARGRLKPQWDGILAACEKLLAEPPDVSEPLKYQEGEKRGVNDDAWRKRWWGNRQRTEAVCNGAATLAFAWMLGGDERFAQESRRLLMAACAWDVNGATNRAYNDEAGMPFLWGTARAYTWLHGYLSEDDRRLVRECMAARGDEAFQALVRKQHLWRPYDSHANRLWHKVGEVGTAFYGEIEGAGDWAWFAMNVFFNSYPVWNDDAGGWHEGLAYWNGYQSKVTWWLALMQSIYGLDGYRKPFFANAGNFPLYVAPPGETLGGFGDLTLGSATAKSCSPTVSIFARMARNPYWEWYVSESGGAELPGGYMGFIYGTTEPVASKEPTDLPSSVLFPGVGVAALHNDLTKRQNDVLFMLKSSPMGTQSHGYDSQNAFLLSVAGDPVFVYTGWRDLYGSPHHRDWMWETKSQNCILVNGVGQKKRSNLPLGEITRFATAARFDYVAGEAAPAYEGAVSRFTRAALFLKPEAIVLFDVLEAPQPSTFQWLLHARTEMQVEGQAIHARGLGSGAAIVQLLAPQGLQITQTNQFDPPPQEWVKLEQWHLQAATPAPATAACFVSVIRPQRPADPDPPLEAQALESPDALGCELALADGRAVVVWRKSGEGQLSLGEVTTDGEAACVVLAPDGAVRESFLHAGTTLSYRGRLVR
ncbi:MAG: DUF4962 domain-containing protein [Armatimonadetes bacterium]|nr:DUF4962 domain-containing protein [Armatimonadota bacterium]